VLDHMGHQSTAAGWASAAFQQVLGLVRDGAWVKLSGAYRVSAEEPPYRDTICYAQSLIEASPERCVWGSDWPHVATWTTMPTVGKVLDTLALWAPEPAIRDAILTTNAHRLYGFR
jgi:2-pyrone-4,6-dicarboxylate lactonase